MRALSGLTLGLLAVGIVTQSWATAPVHVWSERFGSTGSDEGTFVAVDGSGNVFVTGDFQGTANFGGANLVSAGGIDIFLAKYDANGAHLWSKRFGGTGADRPIVLAVDAAGSVVVTGLFSATVDFGGGPIVAGGSNDIFLVKYDAAGAHQWSHGFGDLDTDAGWDVTTDGAGNVTVVGWFGDTVNLGGGNLTSAGKLDIVAAKFDASGVHQWSQRFGGLGFDQGISVKTDGSGNIFIAAQSDSAVDFGGGPLVSAGAMDIYLAKLDASGAHQWSERFGDVGLDQPAYVALDNAGNVVLAGIFAGTVDFGGGPLTSAGSFDIILAKYDTNGAHQWSERFGGTGEDTGQTIAVDGSGNVAITGFFADTVDFGGGPLTSAGSADIFLAMYDAAGAHQWSQSFGAISNDNGNSIAFAGPGSVVATGFFRNTVDFGGGGLVSAGSGDVFLAKFSYQNPVPVLITSFNAAPKSGGIDVTWNFSSDEELDGFSLYRGRDRAPSVMIAGGDPRTTRSYTDASVEPGATYRYELVIRTTSGDEFRSQAVTVTVPRAETALGQNFPNPFNPRTTIEYTVGTQAPVAIEIFDVSGTRVRVLDQGVRETGTHRAEWDGRDASGAPVGSGVFFYRLAGLKGAETRRMVLLK